MTFFRFTQFKKIIFSMFFLCLFTAFSGSFVPVSANNHVTESKQPDSGAINGFNARKVIHLYGSDLLIIDVRSEREFKQYGHIPEAVSIPIKIFSRSLGKIPTDKPILLVCRSGARAENTWSILRGARPTQKNIWFFDGSPKYFEDGTYELD